MKLIQVLYRIFILIFLAPPSFIAAMKMWFKWMFNFLKYGGEMIAYSKKVNRKTILDVFEKLIEEEKN